MTDRVDRGERGRPAERARDGDDAKRLAELGHELPAIDLDATSAERIAFRARESLGRGPSPLRFGEPVLVAIFTTSFLVWALMKVLEVFR